MVDLGIPWALVRNCVMVPTVIWMISHLASMVGLLLFHWLNTILILSVIGFQGWSWLVLFPIQGPRQRMVWPSLAISIVSCSGVLVGRSFRVVMTLLWCSCDPIRRFSVFSMLNFAPDVQHHWERMAWRVSYLSCSDR